MLEAKRYSIKSVNVALCSTVINGDVVLLNQDFNSLSTLNRTVCDINPLLQGKRLPLIADVFSKFKECEQSDYYIYTNVDIALMPFFYDAVANYINQGHDAIMINRRRLSKKYADTSSLEIMYADIGKSHPGFDCFVFKRELLEKFVLDEICVGVPFLEVTLLHNIAAFAQNPKYVLDAHLTFHIGMDVMPARNRDYYWHNRNTYFKKIEPILKPHLSLKKFPYAYLPWYQRALKWMLNPSMFTREYVSFEVKGLRNKLNEIRWRLLQR